VKETTTISWIFPSPTGAIDPFLRPAARQVPVDARKRN